MKTLVWTAPEEMRIQDLQTPSIQNHDVLVRVDTVGICGSEIEGFLGHNSLRTPPLIMGHEFCGYIEKIGNDVNSLNVGDKVIVNPLIGCGDCNYCKNSRENICKHRSIIGIHRSGAFAELVSVPASNIHVIPSSINSARAALAEPLACSLRATKQAVANHSFANVLVFGGGTIGLLCAKVAKLLGAMNIILLDTNPLRLKTSIEIGMDFAFNPNDDHTFEKIKSITSSKGIDVVIDSAGFQSTRTVALELINTGGTFMNIGLGIDVTHLNINHMIRSEIDILGSFCYSAQDFSEAINLLVNDQITEQGWTDLRLLDEGHQAFIDLVSGSVSKAKILLSAK